MQKQSSKQDPNTQQTQHDDSINGDYQTIAKKSVPQQEIYPASYWHNGNDMDTERN